MTLTDRMLFRLARHELSRNSRFRNLHQGERCYIFGNGASLKGMDLARFRGKLAIGCNSLFLHKDFDQLDCRYYQIPTGYLFYPYRRWGGRIQKNQIGRLYGDRIRAHRATHFFTSLSNVVGLRGPHISYTHHFGSRQWNLAECDMDGVFSFMAGAMFAMLGTAIYMGFSSAVLVGCDYTLSPRRAHHFFEKGAGVATEDDEVYGGMLFAACQQRIDLLAIVPPGARSTLLKYETYDDHVGARFCYRENTEIVERTWLDHLDRQRLYRIY